MPFSPATRPAALLAALALTGGTAAWLAAADGPPDDPSQRDPSQSDPSSDKDPPPNGEPSGPDLTRCGECGPRGLFDVKPITDDEMLAKAAPSGTTPDLDKTREFVRKFAAFLPEPGDAGNAEVLRVPELPNAPVRGDGTALPKGDPSGTGPELNRRYLETPHPAFVPRPCFSRLRLFADVPIPEDPAEDERPPRIAQDRSDADYFGRLKFDHLVNVELADAMGVAYVKTPPGIYPAADPFRRPPGTNMLPTVYADASDANGDRMPNTLPSLPDDPYHLHDAEPVTTRLDNEKSPTDDLREILDDVYEVMTDRPYRQLWERYEEPRSAEEHFLDPPIREGETAEEYRDRTEREHLGRLRRNVSLVRHRLLWALDILEGNDGIDSKVPSSRAYRGFPLLNHSGHNRTARAVPEYDAKGERVGGNVEVEQIWYDGRIQNSAMFIDLGLDDDALHPLEPALRELQEEAAKKGRDALTEDERHRIAEAVADRTARLGVPLRSDLPFTTANTVNVLNGGNDDFATFVMYGSHPWVPPADRVCGEGPPIPRIRNLGMDQTFFPMPDGTKNVFRINNAPAHYYELNYNWGWRKHPPRVQASENAHGRVPPVMVNPDLHTLRPNHERWVFEGYDPDRDISETEYVAAVGCAREKGFPLPEPEGEAGYAARKERLEKQFPDLMAVYGADLAPGDPPLTPAEAAIARLGHLAPAKRMRRAFRASLTAAEEVVALGAAFGDLDENGDRKLSAAELPPSLRSRFADLDVGEGEAGDDRLSPAEWRAARHGAHDLVEDCLRHLLDARDAFGDWKDRTRLPAGLSPDPHTDLTLLFVNNTIYGEYSRGGWTRFEQYRSRHEGNLIKITVLNGDYFPHAFHSVDFGGLRGWENQFKSSLPVGGIGSFFTFGRIHFTPLTPPGAILVDPALPLKGDTLHVLRDADETPFGAQTDAEARTSQGRKHVLPALDRDGGPDGVSLGVQRVMLQFNYDPSPRTRLYNFDPLHHDVAIFPLH